MCVIWGVPYLFIRVAVKHVEPGTLVFFRTAGATVLLLPVALGRGLIRPVLAHWRAVLLFSVVEVMVPWVLLSDAERHLSSSLAGLLVAAVPLIGAVLALVSPNGDRFGQLQLGGLFIGVVGVACLVGLDFGQLDPVAIMEMLVVSVGYATGPLVLARFLSDLPGLGVIASAMTVSTVCLSPFVFFQPPQAMPAGAVLSILVLAAVCTAVAFTLFFQLVAEIGPTRCTIITYVNPAVALLLGVLILGEHLTTGMLVGFPLILVGSVLAARKAGPAPELPAEPVAAVAAGRPDASL